MRHVAMLDRDRDFGTGFAYGRYAHPRFLLNETVQTMDGRGFCEWLGSRREHWLGMIQADPEGGVRHWSHVNRCALLRAREDAAEYLPLYLPKKPSLAASCGRSCPRASSVRNGTRWPRSISSLARRSRSPPHCRGWSSRRTARWRRRPQPSGGARAREPTVKAGTASKGDPRLHSRPAPRRGRDPSGTWSDRSCGPEGAEKCGGRGRQCRRHGGHLHPAARSQSVDRTGRSHRDNAERIASGRRTVTTSASGFCPAAAETA